MPLQLPHLVDSVLHELDPTPPVLLGVITVARHGVEKLVGPRRPGGRVEGKEAVEEGRAGAGQADHKEGLRYGLLQDVRIPGKLGLEPELRHEPPEEEVVRGSLPDGGVVGGVDHSHRLGVGALVPGRSEVCQALGGFGGLLLERGQLQRLKRNCKLGLEEREGGQCDVQKTGSH